MNTPLSPEALRSAFPPRLARFAEEFLAAGSQTGMDPLVLAAICDRESRGGEALTPPGPGGTGDHGFGHGLMQIDSRSHKAFIRRCLFDGSPAWAVPGENILYGAQVLLINVRIFQRQQPSLPAELVLAAAVAAYNCGSARVRQALRELPAGASIEEQLDAVDTYTARGPSRAPDYSRDVLARARRFRNLAAMYRAA